VCRDREKKYSREAEAKGINGILMNYPKCTFSGSLIRGEQTQPGLKLHNEEKFIA